MPRGGQANQRSLRGFVDGWIVGSQPVLREPEASGNSLNAVKVDEQGRGEDVCLTTVKCLSLIDALEGLGKLSSTRDLHPAPAVGTDPDEAKVVDEPDPAGGPQDLVVVERVELPNRADTTALLGACDRLARSDMFFRIECGGPAIRGTKA